MACIEERLEHATPEFCKIARRANSLPAVLTRPWRQAAEFPRKRGTLPALHYELYDLTINDGASSVGSTSMSVSRQNSKGCIFDQGIAQETLAVAVQLANASGAKLTMQQKLAARRAKLEGSDADSSEIAKTKETAAPGKVESPFFSKREAPSAEVLFGPFRQWHRPNEGHALGPGDAEVDAWSLDDWKAPEQTVACHPLLDDKAILDMRHQVVAAVLAEVHSDLELAVRDMHSKLRTWIAEEVAAACCSLREASHSVATIDAEKECSPSPQGERFGWKEPAMACNTSDLLRPSAISQEAHVVEMYGREVDRGKLDYADASTIADDLMAQLAVHRSDLEAVHQKTLGRLDEELRLVRTRMQDHEEQYEKVVSEIRNLSMQMDCRPTRVDMSTAFATRDGHFNWLESQVQDILLLLNGPPK